MKKYLGTAVGEVFNIISDRISLKEDKMDQMDASAVKDIWNSLKGKSGIKIKIIDINNNPCSGLKIEIGDNKLKLLEEAKENAKGSILMPLDVMYSTIIFTGMTDENGEINLRKEDLPDYVFSGYKNFKYHSIGALDIQITKDNVWSNGAYLYTPLGFNYSELTIIRDADSGNASFIETIMIADGKQITEDDFKSCGELGNEHMIFYKFLNHKIEEYYILNVTSDEEILSFLREYINKRSINDIKDFILYKECLVCGIPVAYAKIDQLINSSNDGIKEDAVLEWVGF